MSEGHVREGSVVHRPSVGRGEEHREEMAPRWFYSSPGTVPEFGTQQSHFSELIGFPPPSTMG